MVAVPSADVEGRVLNKNHVDANEANRTSTVTFTVVTRWWDHGVDLRFTQVSTMTASSIKIRVTVVDT